MIQAIDEGSTPFVALGFAIGIPAALIATGASADSVAQFNSASDVVAWRNKEEDDLHNMIEKLTSNPKTAAKANDSIFTFTETDTYATRLAWNQNITPGAYTRMAPYVDDSIISYAQFHLTVSPDE